MTEHDRADQARKGLIDSIKGKAKEVAGAVLGNDSLTAEGQLEQTQAQERKEANSVEAVADAEAAQARGDIRVRKPGWKAPQKELRLAPGPLRWRIPSRPNRPLRSARRNRRANGTPYKRRPGRNSTLSARWSGRKPKSAWT